MEPVTAPSGSAVLNSTQPLATAVTFCSPFKAEGVAPVTRMTAGASAALLPLAKLRRQMPLLMTAESTAFAPQPLTRNASSAPIRGADGAADGRCSGHGAVCVLDAGIYRGCHISLRSLEFFSWIAGGSHHRAPGWKSCARYRSQARAGWCARPRRVNRAHRVHAQDVSHGPAAAPTQRLDSEVRLARGRVERRANAVDVARCDHTYMLANHPKLRGAGELQHPALGAAAGVGDLYRGNALVVLRCNPWPTGASAQALSIQVCCSNTRLTRAKRSLACRALET